MATNIFKLLLTLGVKCSEISCVLINPKAGYAKIQVHRYDCEDYLVKVLLEVKSIMSLFDLRRVLENPAQAQVVRIRQATQTHSYQEITNGGTSTYRLANGEAMPQLLHNNQLVVNEYERRINSRETGQTTAAVNILEKSSETTSTLQIEFEELVEDESKIMQNEATSVSDLSTVNKENQQEKLSFSEPNHGLVMASRKTSTPSDFPCDCPETVFYNRFQHVGTETRYSEFKKGGVIYDQTAFRAMVAKYVCGFCNAQGGTLFFGVSDDGIVRGIAIDKMLEKTLQSDVDFAVGLIQPAVNKCEYSVKFTRVTDGEKTFSCNLKVLEVCVKPPKPGNIKYSYNGVVYIKKDGSLQKVTQ